MNYKAVKGLAKRGRPELPSFQRPHRQLQVRSAEAELSVVRSQSAIEVVWDDMILLSAS
jgi:hypothetical protein